MEAETNIQVQWNVDENDSNAVIWYEVEYPGCGKEVQKVVTRTNYVYVRTSPTLSSYYCSNNESLMNCCRMYTAASEKVVRMIIYSNEGYQKRTQIKRKIEEQMDRTTCTYIVLTCGLLLCFAGCCFPCFTKTNPKLDEMNFCRQLNELYPDQTNNSSSIRYTFATTKGSVDTPK